MTENELCRICTEYSCEEECDNKRFCQLLGILRENKYLKVENKNLRISIRKFRAKLKELNDTNLIDASKLVKEIQKYFVNNKIHKNDLAQIIAELLIKRKNNVNGKWIYGDIDENGHWINGSKKVRCSECWRIFDSDNQNIWHWYPQCGAKMTVGRW